MMEQEKQIVGLLKEWSVDNEVGPLTVKGRIFLDRRGKFQDGNWIRTSEIVEWRKGMVITRNSIYLLEEQAY